MRTVVCAFLLVFSLAAFPAFPQETRGNIPGTVQDSTGVVPGAVVKVANVDTGVSQTLVTNVNGFHNAPLLNPGNYQVSVEMAGYKALIHSGVTLPVGQQVSINMSLEVQNLFNRQGWNAPNLNPTSTQFGMITTPSGMAMRFVTFVAKYTF